MNYLVRPFLRTKLLALYGMCVLTAATFTSAYFIQKLQSEDTLPLTSRTSALISPSTTSPAQKNSLAFKVHSGDTLMSILQDAGIDRNDAAAAIETLARIYDPEKLQVGQHISISFDLPNTTKEGKVPLILQSLSIKTASLDKTIRLQRTKQNGFTVKEIAIPLEKHMVRAKGIIQTSLLGSANDMNVPVNIMLDIAKAYSYDVDFQRDIQPGDTFEVLFERFYNKEGELVRDGNVLFASLTLGDRTLTLYHHTTASGESDYYTADGRSIRKDLLRTPINIVHITSKFGRRIHPVLGYSKMHKGVDFAAPIGTPIFAAGAGVVEEIGRKGSYGNYIRIRHNSGYSTAYAHTSRFAKGLRRGDQVKQGDVVAYVGATGRATGPHLHYEVLHHAQQIDPLKAKQGPNIKLAGAELQRFQSFRQKVSTMLAKIPERSDVALSSSSQGDLIN